MNDNGILEQVPGQYVGEAVKTLPPAATAEDRDYFVEIDAGHVGRVRLTFRKQKAKRGKFSHWFWRAKRADATRDFLVPFPADRLVATPMK